MQFCQPVAIRYREGTYAFQTIRQLKALKGSHMIERLFSDGPYIVRDDNLLYTVPFAECIFADSLQILRQCHASYAVAARKTEFSQRCEVFQLVERSDMFPICLLTQLLYRCHSRCLLVRQIAVPVGVVMSDAQQLGVRVFELDVSDENRFFTSGELQDVRLYLIYSVAYVSAVVIVCLISQSF